MVTRQERVEAKRALQRYERERANIVFGIQNHEKRAADLAIHLAKIDVKIADIKEILDGWVCPTGINPLNCLIRAKKYLAP